MALFKIFKGDSSKFKPGEGQSSNIKKAKEGYAYFTTDDGKFYIDISGDGNSDAVIRDSVNPTGNRVPLNAYKADIAIVADKATKDKNENDIDTSYWSLKDGIEITSSENLNSGNYKRIGNYYCNLDSIAQSIVNLPIESSAAKAFILKVSNAAGTAHVKQDLYFYDSGQHFSRTYINDSWGIWQLYPYISSNSTTQVTPISNNNRPVYANQYGEIQPIRALTISAGDIYSYVDNGSKTIYLKLGLNLTTEDQYNCFGTFKIQSDVEQAALIPFFIKYSGGTTSSIVDLKYTDFQDVIQTLDCFIYNNNAYLKLNIKQQYSGIWANLYINGDTSYNFITEILKVAPWPNENSLAKITGSLVNTLKGIAEKAISDNEGNNIASTYLKKIDGITNLEWVATNEQNSVFSLRKTINNSTTSVFNLAINNPTLSWNATAVIATIGTKDISVKMPANPNRYRPIQVNSSAVLTNVESTALNLIAGDNISLSNDGGNITINAGGNTDRYINSATFTNVAVTAAPIKMTLTRAGSDTVSVTASIPKVSATSAGVAPAGESISTFDQSSKFLRSDGTWATPKYTTSLSWDNISNKPEVFYSLPVASSTTLGGIKIGYSSSNTRDYAIQLDVTTNQAYVNVPWTDTKVTSVANHYSPTATSTAELTASLTGSANDYSLNTEYTVLTGIKAQRDAKGHVTGLTYTAQKIKDTNVDKNVEQGTTTTSSWRKILLNSVTNTSGADVPTTHTGAVYSAVGVEVQPSTGTLKATKLSSSSLSVSGTATFDTIPTAPTAESGDQSTKLATTEFVYNAFIANDAMVFKGLVSSNTALPATHKQGWTYKVADSSTHAGQTCEAGDTIYCITDGTTANNSHWVVVQNNIDILPVSKGGTGKNSMTANSVVMTGASTTAAFTTRTLKNNTAATAAVTSTNIITENTLYYALPTINNSKTYTSSSKFYAPTTGGTADYVLMSNGTTAIPTWKTFSDLINTSTTGTSDSEPTDYLISQYAGGNSSTNANAQKYYRREVQKVVNDKVVKLALGTNTDIHTFLRRDGTWSNTLGDTSSEASRKLAIQTGDNYWAYIQLNSGSTQKNWTIGTNSSTEVAGANGTLAFRYNGVNQGTITKTGSFIAGTATSTTQVNVKAESKAGDIYLYTYGTTTGSRGIYGHNSSSTAAYIISVNQENRINNLADSEVSFKKYIGGTSGTSGLLFGSFAKTSSLSATGTTTYETIDASSWGGIYYSIPSIKKVYSTAGDVTSSATTSITPSQLYFIQYSINTSTTNPLARDGNYEVYYLPATTNDRTSNGSYYIPTSKGGTANYILMANGAATSTSWVSQSTLNVGSADKVNKSLTLTLNNSSTTFNGTTAYNVSWYAPMAGGSKGYLLVGDGTTAAPIWDDSLHVNTSAATSTNGYKELVIGNSSAVETAGCQRGRLALYSPETKGTYLVSAANSTAWYTATLQAKTGIVAYTLDITNAINDLDVSAVGGETGEYISKISQTDGKIVATKTVTTVSNAWTTATTTGPTLKTSVNGITSTATAIPIATDGQSGVVTTTAQTFAGQKTFKGSLLPESDNTYNLGSASLGWATVFTHNIRLYKNSIAYTNNTGTTATNFWRTLISGEKLRFYTYDPSTGSSSTTSTMANFYFTEKGYIEAKYSLGTSAAYGQLLHEKSGTTSVTGYAALHLGNTTPVGTTGNGKGRIYLYGSETAATVLYSNLTGSTNRAVYFPNYTETAYLAHTGSTTAIVGATNQPVYVAANGKITAITGVVANTAASANKVNHDLTLTLNNTTKTFDGSTAQSATWYAPTTGGTDNYILTSNGSTSIPTWKAPPVVYCDTPSATAAKVGICENYTLGNTRVFYLNVVNANTSKTALTLNINGAGAKPIYINASASTTSNYTIPKGQYLVYWNGINYYLFNNGSMRFNALYTESSITQSIANTYRTNWSVATRDVGMPSVGTSTTVTYETIAGTWIQQMSEVPSIQRKYATTGDASSLTAVNLIYPTRWYLNVYSYTFNGSNINAPTLTHLNGYERYQLPQVDSGLSTSKTYNILTTKNIVTIAQGGTGLTASPAMIVNLSSNSSVNVFQASPSPGVTGTLAVANGGTGKSSMTANSVVMTGTSTTAAFTTRTLKNNTAATAAVTSTNIITENTLYYALPTINDSKAYTSSSKFYAPTSTGTIRQFLRGNNTWSNILGSVSDTASTSLNIYSGTAYWAYVRLASASTATTWDIAFRSDTNNGALSFRYNNTNKVLFSQNGDISLMAGNTNSPSLIFSRGTNSATDTYVDWKQQVISGALNFSIAEDASTWRNKVNIASTGLVDIYTSAYSQKAIPASNSSAYIDFQDSNSKNLILFGGSKYSTESGIRKPGASMVHMATWGNDSVSAYCGIWRTPVSDTASFGTATYANYLFWSGGYVANNIAPFQTSQNYNLGTTSHRWNTGFFSTYVRVGANNTTQTTTDDNSVTLSSGGVFVNNSGSSTNSYGYFLRYGGSNYAKLFINTVGTDVAAGLTILQLGYNNSSTTSARSRGQINLYGSTNTNKVSIYGSTYGYLTLWKTDSSVYYTNKTGTTAIDFWSITQSGEKLRFYTHDPSSGSETAVSTTANFYFTEKGYIEAKYSLGTSAAYGKLLLSTAGTTSVTGYAELHLGNNIPTETTGNGRGRIYLYGSGAAATVLYSNLTGSTNRAVYFPNYAGTTYLAHTGSTTDIVGATNQPVYVAANGKITAITGVIANTAASANKVNHDLTLTLNNSAKTFNGSAVQSATWYAPTTGGTANYVLVAAGTTATPTWKAIAWSAWTAGTTAGPKANITIGTTTYTSATIPIASTTQSGVVTTTAQSFVGVKTFSTTTDSSSVSTGTVIIKGGLGVAKKIYASAVYGAVWNDYAEFRQAENNVQIKPGKVVKETGNDTLKLTEQRLERGCNIVSDTFGFAIGETKQAKLPIAVSGRVLAYPYEDKEEFKSHIGWPVCSGPDGTVSIMTEEEEIKYPSRIIGTISAVPDYAVWHGGQDVIVDGRVWIKVR